ncbi:uncharacterized protein [Henckelia pumila]|uniref:uncharacterized protein n=1 Tax=Henckelia pumila TaxID=405737 RepID=UPI003C6E41D7
MSIVLRFVDKDGYVQERFFGIVHVKDTVASTLKECIFSVLSCHNLDVQNIRGQGYDGANGTTPAQRGDADAAYEVLTSFEFVFILHLMRKILEISNLFCQALKLKSQDILNAMHLVSSTKLLIQKLRDDGWDELVENVKSFCQAVNIPMPDFNAQYIARRGRARHQQEEITVEHRYKVDIFNAVIDSQLQELNCKFNDNTVE